jgi:nucleoside-diphosphate-sugar epimerase
MRVFLTGGTGFVGSHVADYFVEYGAQVVALVRPTSDIDHLSRLGVEMVEGALGDAAAFEEALSDVDAVVHVAGMTASSDRDLLYAVNVEGTRDLVDTVARVCEKDTRFIYISSVAAQGPSTGKLPRPNTQLPEPVSQYGRTKLGGEGAVLAHRDQLEVTILRPPVIYGPRDVDVYQIFSLANRRLAPIMGGGDRWLSIIHVEDVARAIGACLGAPGDGEVYPIDDGSAYTWRELGELVAQAVGKKAIAIPVPKAFFAGAAVLSEVGGRLRGVAPTFDRDKYAEMVQRSWVCGHQSIGEDLDWEPKWDLAGGAKQTAQWYREQGWL